MKADGRYAHGRARSNADFIESAATEEHRVVRVSNASGVALSAGQAAAEGMPARTLHERELKRIALRLPEFEDIATFKALSMETRVPLERIEAQTGKALHALVTRLAPHAKPDAKAAQRAGKAISHITAGLARRNVRTYSPEFLHSLVRMQLQAGTPPYAAYWQLHPQLAQLYGMIEMRDGSGASRRKTGVKGAGFFGTGGWYGYLRKFHKISTLRQAGGNGKAYRRNEYYPGELKFLAGRAFGRLQSTAAKDWIGDVEANKIYHALRARDAGGEAHASLRKTGGGFFGHGNLTAFLERTFPDAAAGIRPEKRGKPRKPRAGV